MRSPEDCGVSALAGLAPHKSTATARNAKSLLMLNVCISKKTTNFRDHTPSK
jgi:hypothetical protein